MTPLEVWNAASEMEDLKTMVAGLQQQGGRKGETILTNFQLPWLVACTSYSLIPRLSPCPNEFFIQARGEPGSKATKAKPLKLLDGLL